MQFCLLLNTGTLLFMDVNLVCHLNGRVLREISGPSREKGTNEWPGRLMRSLILCSHRHYWNNQIKKDDTDKICSTCGRGKKCIQNFSQETWWGHLGDLHVHRKITLKCIGKYDVDYILGTESSGGLLWTWEWNRDPVQVGNFLSSWGPN
jgi:hypothetical protein